MNRQRTKIVCTMGPSTESDDVLRQMIAEGMRVARFNFSHGDHTYHAKAIRRVRRVAKELGITVALMADTKGPEIRTRKNEGGVPITLSSGDTVRITSRDVKTKDGLIALDYERLASDVEKGSMIYVDDGLVALRVEAIDGDDIIATALNGGVISEHKGVNVPNVILGLPPVTDRDVEDIAFACKMNMDAIAVSFVCDASAPRRVREVCKEYGQPDTLVISKIESSLAIQNFDEILEASDGIMVARGDLGVEIRPAEVPRTQKQIISACNKAFVPVITATQMLDSMTHSPRPTRAEVTDVANSIYDGTDCVMLSGETAAGAYPVESVRMMAEICRESERFLETRPLPKAEDGTMPVGIASAYSAVELAQRVGASAILCPTLSGRTARVMSSLRPSYPIIATTPRSSTIIGTCFMWGVEAIKTKTQPSLSRTFTGALKAATAANLIQPDDIVIITAGDPLTSPMTSGLQTDTNVCVVAQAI